jgi:murein DD-endopeptidase MepM/ murein hydrolase activator NlpD
MRPACGIGLLLWVTPIAAAEPLYRLPWNDARPFMIVQAPDGRITTHITKATFHAVDIEMPVGVPVVAARAGIVEALEEEHGKHPEEEPSSYEGNFLRIQHGDGTAAIYAHLAPHSLAVKVGETVQAGQLLGRSGASGDVVQPHLHFALVRRQTNASGWSEEISLPVTFFVGVPPVAFPPRAAVRVTADYSGPVRAPRAPSEWQPLVPWRPIVLAPWEEIRAWCLLAAWIAAGVAGFGWFWRFSRE